MEEDWQAAGESLKETILGRKTLQKFQKKRGWEIKLTVNEHSSNFLHIELSASGFIFDP